jgi:hypothetical protein
MGKPVGEEGFTVVLNARCESHAATGGRGISMSEPDPIGNLGGLDR